MKVAAYIDDQFNRFVSELQAWCRQPSVSGANRGIPEMVALVRETLIAAGLAVQVFTVPGGHPVVYAERKGTTDKTLLFYGHYDVQPPEPLEAWASGPFEAEVRDGRLFARGVADDKACLLSRVQAVEALLKTRGELPVSVKFLVEGEEEIGSSHLRPFVESHKELLAADWCIWEYAAKNELGYPTMTLGNKGLCYLQLTAAGPSQDWHSMFAPVIPNPAWRLVWALASLKNERDEILVEGFYHDVAPLSEAELAALARIPTDAEKLKASAGLDHLVQDVEGIELKKRLYAAPTCNICGFTAGHVHSGKKGIVPARATAHVDLRLVVNQQPADILDKVRRHLVAHGFGDIQVEMLEGMMPAKTAVNTPFVDVVVQAARRAYKNEITVLPTSPGAGPREVFSTWTDMPIVGLGVGHAGSGVHGPNENVILEDYREGIQHIAALIEQLGISSA